MDDIRTSLEHYGELEWYRGTVLHGPWAVETHSVLIAWRYKFPTIEQSRCLEDAVASYRGSVEWVLKFAGRNWSLLTRDVAEFLQGFRVDVEGHDAYSKQWPDKARASREDLRRLLAHLRERSQEIKQQREL
jgi:hypothetical protein